MYTCIHLVQECENYMVDSKVMNLSSFFPYGPYITCSITLKLIKYNKKNGIETSWLKDKICDNSYFIISAIALKLHTLVQCYV